MGKILLALTILGQMNFSIAEARPSPAPTCTCNGDPTPVPFGNCICTLCESATARCQCTPDAFTLSTPVSTGKKVAAMPDSAFFVSMTNDVSEADNNEQQYVLQPEQTPQQTPLQVPTKHQQADQHLDKPVMVQANEKGAALLGGCASCSTSQLRGGYNSGYRQPYRTWGNYNNGANSCNGYGNSGFFENRRSARQGRRASRGGVFGGGFFRGGC